MRGHAETVGIGCLTYTAAEPTTTDIGDPGAKPDHQNVFRVRMKETAEPAHEHLRGDVARVAGLGDAISSTAPRFNFKPVETYGVTQRRR